MGGSAGCGAARRTIQGLTYFRGDAVAAGSEQNIDTGENFTELLLDDAADAHSFQVVTSRNFKTCAEACGLFRVG